jgi:hypothetical protein
MKSSPIASVLCPKYWAFCLILFLCGGSIASAAAFQNLDFELADVSNPHPNGLLISQALPGCTAITCYPGYIGYNYMALDSVYVSIHDGLQVGHTLSFYPLQGRYSIMLQDGFNGQDDQGATVGSASISQIGDIPTDSKSLMFSSDTSDYIKELQVSINGAVLPIMLYSTGDTVNVGWPAFGPVKTYACDITAYAG